jgi:hypothetical protein
MSLSETNWQFLLIGRIGNIHVVAPDRTYLFDLIILIRTIPEQSKVFFLISDMNTA